MYTEGNRDLCNLLFCAKEKTLPLIRELDFLPLQSREEFDLLKRFLKGKNFTQEFLGEQLEVAEECFPPEEAAELKALLRGRAAMADALLDIQAYDGEIYITEAQLPELAADLIHLARLPEEGLRRLLASDRLL